MSSGSWFLLGGGGAQPFPWPPAPRPPYTLPPYNGDRILPYTPDPLPNLRQVRKSSWGTPIYDANGTPLPFVPEGSSVQPQRCLTPYFNRWAPPYEDAKWQELILDTQVRDGMTHFGLWMADALRGPRSLSEDAYVTQCQRIRARGFWLSHWLGSKTYSEGSNVWLPRDGGPTEWQAVLGPILQQLVAADAIHHAVMGGEYNLWNDPSKTLANLAWLRSVLPPPVLIYLHLTTWETWWGDTNRFDFTSRACDAGLRGLYFQLDSFADIPTCQARVNDTLGNPNIDVRFDIVADEVVASAEFDGNPPTEIDACAKAYAVNCTRPRPVDNGTHVWGFGDAGYRPDGTAL